MTPRLESVEFVLHSDCEEWAEPPIEDSHGEHALVEGLAGDCEECIAEELNEEIWNCERPPEEVA